MTRGRTDQEEIAVPFPSRGPSTSVTTRHSWPSRNAFFTPLIRRGAGTTTTANPSPGGLPHEAREHHRLRDGHLLEPHDLWERYIRGALRAKAPGSSRPARAAIRIAMEGRLYPQPKGRQGLPGTPEACTGSTRKGRVESYEIVRPQFEAQAMDTTASTSPCRFPTLGLYTVDAATRS